MTKTPSKPVTSLTSNEISILGKGQAILSDVLANQRGKYIHIVVAFASKTEDVIRKLLKDNQEVTLTVGTINHFTDPVFVANCLQLREAFPNKFRLFVDFRGDASIHWKLYLFSKETVVVGSPNLTLTGLSMTRETAVVIENHKLYNSYLRLINKLHEEKLVINSQDGRFERYLAEYTARHRRLSTQRLSSESNTASNTENVKTSFSEWYERENTNLIPLYIWDSEITDEVLRVFKTKVAPKINKNKRQIETTINVIAAYKASSKEQYYFSGDTVLFMDEMGRDMGFVKVEIALFAEGRWWLCEYEEADAIPPFEITPNIERAMRSQVRLYPLHNRWTQPAG